MFLEILKFVIYSALIILISKFILVKILRSLAENLKLKPQKIGEIAGYATSMPELLTICISSFNGLISASIFNVISSNIINFIQYLFSIIVNKNIKTLKNKALKIDIILVILTIIIPIIFIFFKIEINMKVVPVFILLYILFKYVNNNIHKLYLKKEDKIIQNEIEKENKIEIGNKKRLILHIIYLILTGIILFFIGDRLGIVLEKLCNIFNIPEFIIGIILGITTSIPELITFFESQKHYKNKKDEKILGVVEATNNLLISNILNLFIIQSIGIIIYSTFFIFK